MKNRCAVVDTLGRQCHLPAKHEGRAHEIELPGGNRYLFGDPVEGGPS
jgi:hypothetical protein